jgi:hypothetical protein
MTSTSALRVAGHGLSVVLPHRWEARLYLRDTPAAEVGVTRRAMFAHPFAHGHPGEMPNPVLHLANFALPPGRGDFGTGAVERMRAHHAFMSLFEYDRAEVGRSLFAAQGVPRLSLGDFAGNALQRHIAGQLGCQRFFTENGRAFCLYVVLGSREHAPNLLAEVRQVSRRLEVGTR